MNLMRQVGAFSRDNMYNYHRLTCRLRRDTANSRLAAMALGILGIALTVAPPFWS